MSELEVLKIMLKQYEERNCYSQSEALKWAIKIIEEKIKNDSWNSEKWDRE